MKQNDTLNEIRQMVLHRRLGQSISALENYLLTHQRQQDMDQLVSIRDDYRLMAGYWQRGFDDPQRQQVYDQLLRRMFVLTQNVATRWMLGGSPYLKAIHLRPRKARTDWSVQAIRAGMEAFVSGVALLELEPEHTRKQKSEALHREHADLMRDLFDYIVTSRPWRESLADAFIDLLLSPTLASIDQQLIVSAVMLSAMQMFCFQKLRVLCEVYRQATDEPLRQRALVGWVFTLLAAPADIDTLYPEMGQQVAGLLADDRAAAELAELQMQLVYCLQADADRDTIQKEILPDIMSGSRLQMTRGGLAEMDEDSLDDILHPEASEQAMERMEQSVRRMVDMQKQGADIYFGGFSQMKRFSFFSDLSNWFVPFYSQHPGISPTWNNARGGNFLKTITRLGAFCDSDKYSFVLAYNMVLDRLPKNILQMIEQGEASAMPVGGEVPVKEQSTPAFIRRVYLQNLFRFFRLFPTRSEFPAPFGELGDVVFFARRLLCHEALAQQALGVASFLMKRRCHDEAVSVLLNTPEVGRDLQYYIMLGNALQRSQSGAPQREGVTAEACFRRALQLQPGNERALAGLARALYAKGDYAEAQETYSQLLLLKPEQKSFQMGAAVCMLNLEQTDEALKLLFKLSYLHPDDLSVVRLLAWAQTLSGKYEQADKLYRQLLAAEQPQPADLLNHGYCLLFARRIGEAADTFRRYRDARQDDAFNMADEFLGAGHHLLRQRGITDTEILLMIDTL